MDPKARKRRELPPREIEICKRLREARELLRLTQGEVAHQLGISRERLASYEDARHPVRVEVALVFCRQLIFSEEWLAIGEKGILEALPKLPRGNVRTFSANWRRACMGIATHSVARRVWSDEYFSVAYDKHFSAVYQSLRKEQWPFPRVDILRGDNPQMLRNLLEYRLDYELSHLKPHEGLRFLYSLERDAHHFSIAISGGYLTSVEKEFLERNADDDGRFPEGARRSQKKYLDWLARETKRYLRQFEPDKISTPLDTKSIERK